MNFMRTTYRFLMYVLTLVFISGWAGCKPKQNEVELRTGDILFRGAADANLSQAIDKVTQTGKATHFSHMGIAEVGPDGIYVLNSEPKHGVFRQPLDSFLHPDGEKSEVVAYRLKAPFRQFIPEAMKRAEQLLGQPYNYTYILPDTGYYCSEFVYTIFASDSVFKLNPMTFKNPKTGQFDSTWVAHYQKLGIGIPEGKPGCNPNGMAASDKLERLGKVELNNAETNN
ncbi:hypothetical protein PbJCM13498_39320 [Prolixibacter bellariivorans]|uniref:Peptidoglycan peptidase n=2 Tax=Prolixibacter bellariivorans TaxID=314319 RepID=A0A5M4B4H1_9BACT|nr:hypothetical protein PbJCM13498_39320 [Prolixibacter bellariivorans]